MNYFEQKTGADKLRQPHIIGMFFVCAILMAFIIAKWGLVMGITVLIVPIGLFFLASIFYSPKIGIIPLYILNFFALGVYRYIGTVPWGLMIDSILVIIYLALFFKSFNHHIPWSNAKNELTLIAAIWYLYSLFELVNPEVHSRVAWFYGMRSISLYMIMTIPIIFITLNKPKDLKLFFLLWGIFSLMGTLKGIQQKFLGPDHYEQMWLDSGAGKLHILFGVLRVFSFYSDAGQFGASQGHAGVVFAILAMNESRKINKYFYLIVSLFGFYGMMISGTRGAIAVPFAGFALYVFLKKNVKAVSAGVVLLALIFVFFKYTTIGQGNDAIRRMRTAFDPNDPSLQLRLQNQQKIKVYLATRPFGGGLGSTGPLGQQYAPGSFLSSVPSDSWYVKVWMELGMVGLILHLSILFYILGKSTYFIWFKVRDDWIKAQSIALTSGMAGMMVAAYGNGILGQLPSSVLIFCSMAYMFIAPKMDEELRQGIY